VRAIVEEAEFDKFAAEYRTLHAESIRASGESPEYFAEYKIVDVAVELARARGAAPARPAVLDFGAGVGYSVPFFARHLPGARVTCLDVSRQSLDIGASKYGEVAEFRHFDGNHIPYEAGTFDVALASCVFHHIPHDEHVALLAEIHRVLTDAGLLLVFEHNPLNPLTRQAVNSCVFDEHAELVRASTMRRRVRAAGFATAAVRYRIFFPHWARALRSLEKQLTWLPLGAQYYVVANKKKVT
jgi:ubiquinone/menaquinone biosynthesis C-methylase UbiE